MKTIQEKIIEKVKWKITKYASEEDARNKKSFEKKEFEGNCLCNEGIEQLFKLIGIAEADKYDNANAQLIVGTGVGGATANDNEATFTAGVKAGMVATYPQVSAAASHKCTWKASFAAGVANQAWQEFGLLNKTPDGKLLNRKVEDEGTKTAGQVWELELQITLT